MMNEEVRQEGQNIDASRGVAHEEEVSGTDMFS